MVQFREKSLARISSQEDLHDYMRVTSPRLWMLLTVIAALLVGIIVYASTATIENTMDLTVEIKTVDDSEEGKPEDNTPEGAYTYVTATQPLSMKNVLEPGMELRVAGETGTLIYMFNTSEDELGLGFELDGLTTSLPDGEYDATLVLESVSPISFLLNN